MQSIIYGPVSSWRLGRSLGIDIVSTKNKVCSFDCIYCQLGRTVRPMVRRREFVSLSDLARELESVGEIAIDYATFSGVAEPTLASNLASAIGLVGSTLGVPVAVLTNSSLMPREDVRQELVQADVVVAKIDAPDETLFRQINRPWTRYSLAQIIEAIRLFRSEYRGKLALQMMFVDANKSYADAMARIARELSPDEVQINTPLRPCPVRPLPPEDIAAIKSEFSGIKSVVAVYDAPRPVVTPLNLKETLRRRPRL
jgi:wyosine [tRNA(Phe)-imidazoG37] synthetase (radical SAM superfamily)